MDFGAALPSERDEVLDLLARWYDDREFFARYAHNDPNFRDDLCLVAREKGRIVATVQIFDRRVGLAGHNVAMGGIGSVYTDEQARGRGIASELMRLAVATMKRESFEVSLLFAERTDFYERFGWQSVTRQFTALAGADAIAPLADWRLGSFDPARDLDAVARIHREYSGRFETAAIRDDPCWRGNLRYAGNPHEHFVVARAGEEVLAYARAMRFHGFPMVMEYGYRPPAIDAMAALFAHLGAAAARKPTSGELAAQAGEILSPAGTEPSSMLVTHSAHDPQLEDRLRQVGCFLMHHEDRFYMWRVIDAERLAARFGIAPEAAGARLFELVGSPHSLYWTADRF
jgi:GNAT superfamily N-acetyltransferase